MSTYLSVEHVVAVDPDGTSVKRVAHTDGRVEVVGVDGRGQTVRAVVAEGNDLLLVLELGQGGDGTEDLLTHDLHVGLDVLENGGLDEVALVTVALTTCQDGGTLILADLDVFHDAVELQLADLRTLEGLLVEGVADVVGIGTGLEGLDELVVYALLDVDTGTGAAGLAVVVVDTKVDPVDGLLDVGVVEDDVGGLATKLQGNLLQVGGGGSLHDLSADNGGAGEGNLVNVHVGGDGSTSNLAETRDQVEDTGRETSLLDVLSEDEGRERSLLGSLHDDGVTSGQGRANLPGNHHQGEVPGDDLAANTNLQVETRVSTTSQSRRPSSRGFEETYRLVAGVVEHVGVHVDGLANNLVGPAGIVPDAANDGGDITTSKGDGLSVVERLNSSEELSVLLGNIGQLVEELGSVGGGGVLP